MKIAYQRAIGDCGIASLATLIEQSYEDVFLATATVETKRQGRNGIFLRQIQKVAERLGIRLVKKRQPNLEDDEGLLVVQWMKGSRHEIGTQHLVAVGHGVIVDPSDGLVLPPDEYLAREHGHQVAFLELR